MSDKQTKRTAELPNLLVSEVEVPLVGDETFPVVYRVSEYTPAFTRNPQTISEALVKLVSSWGLTRDGKPIPVTLDELDNHIPLPVQRRIYNAIQEDFDPNLQLSPLSSGTS